MATVDEDLRAYLIADPAISKLCGTRIHQNDVPGKPLMPYIWFAKSDDSDEQSLAGETVTVPYSNVYDVECYASSPRVAAELKAAVAARLKNHSGYRSAFGAGTAQGIFVTGQGGDYRPKGIGASGPNSGYHGEAILVDVKGHA